MKNTPRFSPSNIEYLDRMWGVYSGCGNIEAGICHVKACWARSLVKRSRSLVYPMGFDVPTYYPSAQDSPKAFTEPLRIGVGWVGDVIGYGLPFRDMIFSTITACPQHTFLFLTKNYEDLKKWGHFPENCWVGVTVTTNGDAAMAFYGLNQTDALFRYVSYEPLAGGIGADELRNLAHVSDWWITGAQTQPYRPPQREWVREIVETAEKYKIPMFIKDNLKPLYDNYDFASSHWPYWLGLDYDSLRQEYPSGALRCKKKVFTA